MLQKSLFYAWHISEPEKSTEFIQSKDKFFTWQKFTGIDNKEKYWTFLIEQREFGHYWSFNVISSAKRNMPVM